MTIITETIKFSAPNAIKIKAPWIRPGVQLDLFKDVEKPKPEMSYKTWREYYGVVTVANV